MMAINFEPLIKKKKAITHLDDSLLRSHTQTAMFTTVQENRQLLREKGLKAAPDETQFFLRRVKFLGHVISEAGFKQLQKE